MKYVDIIVNNNSKHTDELYTYGADSEINVGQKVKVPFAKGNKVLDGYVVEKNIVPTFDTKKIKSILEIDEDISLSEEMMATALWMKSRYGIKYLDGIKCFTPNGKKAQPGKQKEPYKNLIIDEEDVESLTEEQKKALETIEKPMVEGRQQNFLLHGVTGSGKTELYMQAIKKALEQNKTAIMLVPEIALTKQIIERFVKTFGKETIAVMHSKLTQRERYDEWSRIKNGTAKIVIGARMAVFAPLENIGIIILDEEHEATYKADKVPKYETVDVALKRLIYYKGVLLLGSATPSVVSYERAREGIYTLLEMKKRYNGNPLPEVELVDMGEEMRKGNFGNFSGKLYNEMKKALELKKQVILFINRRGYSPFVLCGQCKEVQKCSDCNISYTYHKKDDIWHCHYCGKRKSRPKECQVCGSKDLLYMGMGTQKVEEQIAKIFPEVTMERFDIDTAKNKKEIERIISGFKNGTVNVLIGTQLVAKGLDFKNVGLVGVIMADLSLSIPDFRSAERTFQLVTQVAGRAGRGEKVGKVVVQTYSPENYALIAAGKQDYKEFFQQEIVIRKAMKYPPFTDLVVPLFTSTEAQIAESVAYECKEYLLKVDKSFSSAHMLNPRISESFISKDSRRYYMIIKCPKELRNKYVHYLSEYSKILIDKKIKCDLTIDVNPFSIY